jgi:divalent metal cation (Fe/Co/Zn/Cd) transporter
MDHLPGSAPHHLSGIVIWVSLQLIRETIDALLDRAPEEFAKQIRDAIHDVEEITEVHRVRVWRAGNKLFADVVIAVPPIYTFVQSHELSERVEKAAMDGVHLRSPQAKVDVLVHVEPTTSPNEAVIDQIHYAEPPE